MPPAPAHFTSILPHLLTPGPPPPHTTRLLPPQITANETAGALEALEAASAWVADKLAEQGKLAAHEAPAFTRDALEKRIQTLKYSLLPLHKRPKPIPTLLPVALNATGNASAGNASGVNGTAPAAANGTAAKAAPAANASSSSSSSSAEGEAEGEGEEEEGEGGGEEEGQASEGGASAGKASPAEDDAPEL